MEKIIIKCTCCQIDHAPSCQEHMYIVYMRERKGGTEREGRREEEMNGETVGGRERQRI